MKDSPPPPHTHTVLLAGRQPKLCVSLRAHEHVRVCVCGGGLFRGESPHEGVKVLLVFTGNRRGYCESNRASVQ